MSNNSDSSGTPDIVASWNAWGVNQLNNVFNNVKTQIQTVDARNNPSVPGGNGNSRYWRLDDYFPKTSTQNKTLDIAKSTSISFGVEGSTGKEASVNFAVGYESGFSTEETVMTVHGTELTSDTGSSSEFKLNVHAIWYFLVLTLRCLLGRVASLIIESVNRLGVTLILVHLLFGARRSIKVTVILMKAYETRYSDIR